MRSVEVASILSTPVVTTTLVRYVICLLYTSDVYKRQIGYSAGEHKTAELVKQAFMKVDGNLSEIHIFHTDRGNEFKNETIEELLETFHMERSLSHKGCPCLLYTSRCV